MTRSPGFIHGKDGKILSFAPKQSRITRDLGEWLEEAIECSDIDQIDIVNLIKVLSRPMVPNESISEVVRCTVRGDRYRVTLADGRDFLSLHPVEEGREVLVTHYHRPGWFILDNDQIGYTRHVGCLFNVIPV